MEIIEGKDLVNKKFILTDDGLLKEYKPQGRFIPKPNNKYWFIDNMGDVVYTSHCNREKDYYAIAHNLVFRTKEECEDYKWFLDMLDNYKSNFTKEDWENDNIPKYYMCYSHILKKISCSDIRLIQRDNCVHFTEENIEKFIETVGEDRIKKYLFDVWE